MLKGAGVTAIITSPATRTKETAKPLATALGITPEVDPMDDAKALVARIRALPGGGNVLVVGHSDSVPQLLKALGHSPAVSIDESRVRQPVRRHAGRGDSPAGDPAPL